MEDGDEFLGLLGTTISLGKGVAFEGLAGIEFESENCRWRWSTPSPPMSSLSLSSSDLDAGPADWPGYGDPEPEIPQWRLLLQVPLSTDPNDLFYGHDCFQNVWWWCSGCTRMGGWSTRPSSTTTSTAPWTSSSTHLTNRCHSVVVVIFKVKQNRQDISDNRPLAKVDLKGLPSRFWELRLHLFWDLAQLDAWGRGGTFLTKMSIVCNILIYCQ